MADRIFEDEFMDAQSSLVGLTVELLEVNEREADKLYIYIFRNDIQTYFNAFFDKDGKIVRLNDYFDDDSIFEYFRIGAQDVTHIEEVCKEFGKPCPNQFKLIYNIATHAFDSDYSYEEINEEEKGLEEILDEWIQECADKLKAE